MLTQRKERQNILIWVDKMIQLFIWIIYTWYQKERMHKHLPTARTVQILFHRTSSISYLPNPSARAGYDPRSIFFLAEFNRFQFRVFLLKAEELSLPYYLPIVGGRIIGFIPFPRVLVLCEMLSVSSRIWTCVAVFISNNDNHYTTGTSRTSSIWKVLKIAKGLIDKGIKHSHVTLPLSDRGHR